MLPQPAPAAGAVSCKNRRGIVYIFWRFSSVSRLGFSCCLVRRSIFKTSDILVLQVDLSPALQGSLLRCGQVLELFEEGEVPGDESKCQKR